MSLPQGGFERRERFGRRRAWMWCAVVLALLLAWSWAVLAWGGREFPEAAEGSEHAGERSPGSGESPDPGASSIPDEPAYAETGGATEGLVDLDAPTQGKAVSEPEAEDGHEDGHDDGHGHPEGGSAGEPGSYDPLGTGAASGDLAPTDEARVRHAAERFVMAAYGYTGSDGAEYLAGVAEASLSPDLSLSAGGPEISRYERQVENSGTKSAAKLTRFESLVTSDESVSANVYFQTGEGYGPNGELTGELLAYRQEITLSRMGEVWKVKATEEIEEAPDEEAQAHNEEER